MLVASVQFSLVCISNPFAFSSAMKELDVPFPWNWSSSWDSRVRKANRTWRQRTEAPTRRGWQQVNISDLMCNRWPVHCSDCCFCLLTARTLHEVSLQESIRYAPADPVEKWLNDLLCLDCLNIPRLVSGCPLPQTCDLYPLLTKPKFKLVTSENQHLYLR